MKKILLFLALLAAFAGCRKDTEETIITETRYTPPVIRVNGTVAGLVTDEQGNPIVGAEVRVGAQQQVTSEGGYFLFRNITLDAGGTFVKVAHSGHFHASRRIFPRANTTNYTSLTLLPLPASGQVSAVLGGSIQLTSGARVTLPANGIARADGSPYTGEVLVSARWLDPTSAHLDQIMPGNLQGISSQDREVALASYGMMAVVLRSPSGERLNLAAGAEAELFFPLPATIRASAPAELPLWHFDEDKGLWRQEGKALRQGDGYTGMVSHFSFWNCDVPFPLVNVQGRVVSQSGAPLPNVRVRVALPDMAQAGSSFTNGDGVFTGKVPAGEPLLLQVITPCGAVTTQMSIGPLGEDTDLGDISTDAISQGISTIGGRLLNCDGEPASRGIVQVCWSNACRYVTAEADGTFTSTIMHCNTSNLELVAFDLDAAFASNPATFSATVEIVTGDIVVCDVAATEFVKIAVEGNERNFLFPYMHVTNGRLNVRTQGSMHNVAITLPDTQAPGTTTGEDVQITYFEYILDGGQWTLSQATCHDAADCSGLSVTITEYGSIGGHIRGHFTYVTDVNSNLTTYPGATVNGEFSVIRTQ